MNTIAKVNEIFQAVNWDEDNEEKVENRGRFYNFGFSIKELKIWDRPAEELGHYNGNATENDGVWSSSRLLEVGNAENWTWRYLQARSELFLNEDQNK